jgi:hypothetical protein
MLVAGLLAESGERPIHRWTTSAAAMVALAAARSKKSFGGGNA